LSIEQGKHFDSGVAMTETRLIHGDCREVLKTLPDHSIDLIFTSPPYADSRANSYGGVKPDEYVNWFLPISAQLLRVLKPTGTFVLNIKEKVVNGERHTYVIELILERRDKVYPTNVLHLATETKNKNHSAVFPEDLPEWFIKLFTKPGDYVLDPFAGSGTTLRVAQKLGRNSLGIELLQQYFDNAQAQLKNAAVALFEEKGKYDASSNQ
jgi:DNA modification methylase